jgi:hypothetical protein
MNKSGGALGVQRMTCAFSVREGVTQEISKDEQARAFHPAPFRLRTRGRSSHSAKDNKIRYRKCLQWGYDLSQQARFLAWLSTETEASHIPPVMCLFPRGAWHAFSCEPVQP